MRQLGDIIESMKDGETPSFEEVYYSTLALVGLMNMATADIGKMAYDEKVTDTFRKLYAEENHNRYKAALNTPPQKYVGWENDPANPDYQEFRAIGKRLLDKIMGEEK